MLGFLPTSVCGSQGGAKVKVFLTALGRSWKRAATMLFLCIRIIEASLDTVSWDLGPTHIDLLFTGRASC